MIIQESADECTKCMEKDLHIRKLEEEATLAKGVICNYIELSVWFTILLHMHAYTLKSVNFVFALCLFKLIIICCFTRVNF